MIATLTTALTMALPQQFGPRSPPVMFHGLLNIYAVHPNHVFSFNHLYTICIPTNVFVAPHTDSQVFEPGHQPAKFGVLLAVATICTRAAPSGIIQILFHQPTLATGFWLIPPQWQRWMKLSIFNTENMEKHISNIWVPQKLLLAASFYRACVHNLDSSPLSKMFQVISISNQVASPCYQKQNRVSPRDWATLNGLLHNVTTFGSAGNLQC